MKAWDIRSAEDLEAFWLKVRDVPNRTEGRSDRPEERYCLGIYLLALAHHGLLHYPCYVEQGDVPDFMIKWASGKQTGLEVTRATESWFQRQMTDADREYGRRKTFAAIAGHKPEPVAWFPALAGWAGAQAEEEWCALIRRAVEKKVAKLPHFRTAEHHDLLIYDDTPLPAVDRRAVVTSLSPWVAQLKGRVNALGKVSVIISLDLIFDIGGGSKIFPYVQWSQPNPEDSKAAVDFSDRAEHAGRIAASRAIRAHKMAGEPVYFLDDRGRLVKQTTDGRRFEVRVQNDGEEITVKELSRG